jgi:hypothetical protein
MSGFSPFLSPPLLPFLLLSIQNYSLNICHVPQVTVGTENIERTRAYKILGQLVNKHGQFGSSAQSDEESKTVME